MLPALLAYGLVVVFLALEALLRQGAAAKSLAASAADRGSTRLIGAGFGLALLLPLLLNLLQVGRLPPAVGWFGLAGMLLGLALRAWSMRVLGASYSRTLRVASAQAVVTHGPYRLIRHPGYLGSLLLWISLSLALANGLSALIVALGLLGIYAYRIRVEEALLLTQLGEPYAAYRARTWRLLPFVY